MGKFIDLTGQKFGRLTVNKRVKDHISPCGKPSIQYDCTCECGTEHVIVSGNALKRGSTKSCGCLNREHISYRQVENLIGQKFGRLLVVGRSEYITKNGKHRLRWVCDCDCGTKNILVIPSHLKDGHTTSCGCKTKDNNKIRCKKYNKYNLDGDFGVCYLRDGESVLFDKEDYDLIQSYYWQLNKYGYVVSQTQTNNIIDGIRMSRLVMGLTKGDPNFVDHIKHNLLDNRKSQLRITTPSQNNQNQSLSAVNTSGVTGVCWDKTRQKWLSYIKINYKQIFLGYYINFNDAIIARKQAEEKYFGEFSYDNSMKEKNDGEK